MQATTDQLLLDLFEGQPNALAKPVAQWINTSKSFAAFVQGYQPKIRKKVRMIREDEEGYNLYCELRTAYILLQEPKFAVAYEPYTKAQGRSADFSVTFRTNKLFHVEVTRQRTPQQEQHLSQQATPQPLPQGAAQMESRQEEQSDYFRRLASRRLADVVCDKFAQLSPESANILWVWSESRVTPDLEIGEVMVGLKRRVEQKDPSLFARYGFGKPADFLRYYQHVSAILVQNLQEPDRSFVWWLNSDCRHPLPAQVANLFRVHLTADRSLPFRPAP